MISTIVTLVLLSIIVVSGFSATLLAWLAFFKTAKDAKPGDK